MPLFVEAFPWIAPLSNLRCCVAFPDSPASFSR